MPLLWWDKTFKKSWQHHNQTLALDPRVCTPTGRFPSSQRMDYPRPGATGNSCFMCNETAHFLNYCLVLLEYIQLRKASRNTQNNMVMLGYGDPIPSNPANHPWVTWINEYYSRNLHLLPQEAVQANFSANLLKFHGQGTLTGAFKPLCSHGVN